MLYFVDFNMFGIHTKLDCILTKNMIDFGQNQAYLNIICSCIYHQMIQLFTKTYKDCLLWQHIVVIFKTFLYQYVNFSIDSSLLLWKEVLCLSLFLSCFSRMKFEEQDNIKIPFSQKLKYCFFSTPSFGYDKVHSVFNSLIVRYEYWQFKSLSKPCDIFVRHYDPDKCKNKFGFILCFIWIYFQDH